MSSSINFNVGEKNSMEILDWQTNVHTIKISLNIIRYNAIRRLAFDLYLITMHYRIYDNV